MVLVFKSASIILVTADFSTCVRHVHVNYLSIPSSLNNVHNKEAQKVSLSHFREWICYCWHIKMLSVPLMSLFCLNSFMFWLASTQLVVQVDHNSKLNCDNESHTNSQTDIGRTRSSFLMAVMAASPKCIVYTQTTITTLSVLMGTGSSMCVMAYSHQTWYESKHLQR